LLIISEALSLRRSSLHVFHDPSSRTIAFNTGGALFFNFLLFQQHHLNDVQMGKSSEAIAYWFVTMCHELAHNIVKDHSQAHSYYSESLITQYFGAIAERTGVALAGSSQDQSDRAAPPPYASIWS
jgi:hypothetical protein